MGVDRSTKAGPGWTGNPPSPRFEFGGRIARSTKAGPGGPATPAHGVFGGLAHLRSTKAGPGGPATPRTPARRSSTARSLNEGRSGWTGNPAQVPQRFHDRDARSTKAGPGGPATLFRLGVDGRVVTRAQRRPVRVDRQPRAGAPPQASHSDTLNEGRSGWTGNPARGCACACRPWPLNEGRSGWTGNPTGATATLSPSCSLNEGRSGWTGNPARGLRSGASTRRTLNEGRSGWTGNPSRIW